MNSPERAEKILYGWIMPSIRSDGKISDGDANICLTHIAAHAEMKPEEEK